MIPQLEGMRERLTEELATARINVLHRQPPSAKVEAELQQLEERQRKKRQILREVAETKREEREKTMPRFGRGRWRDRCSRRISLCMASAISSLAIYTDIYVYKCIYM